MYDSSLRDGYLLASRTLDYYDGHLTIMRKSVGYPYFFYIVRLRGRAVERLIVNRGGSVPTTAFFRSPVSFRRDTKKPMVLSSWCRPMPVKDPTIQYSTLGRIVLPLSGPLNCGRQTKVLPAVGLSAND